MPLNPGTKLGPYEIVAPLGAGGMGEVYRAKDTRVERMVAIKVLPEEFFEDEDRRARFGREARTLASLNHPGIATLFAFEEVSGRHLLAMELVEGNGLDARIAAGPLRLDESLSYARQIAEALEAAHEKGIIHRDLKPANVMITSGGRVKVLDFGLAKALQEEPGSPDLTHAPTLSGIATRAGVILGTASYMSPEQARGKPLDRRTDVWSFGCLLYEMLTGRMAFRGETVSDTMAHVLEREPDWTALPASVPPDIRRLLERCLTKDPKQRLHDIADARLELDPPTSSGVAAWETPAATARVPRRVWSLGAAAVVVVALAVFGIYAFANSRAIPSVAVLPFVNATGNADLEYLGDGIAEELINSLTQVPLLKVIARPTAFSYKGRPAAPRDIGTELKVRAVVMGRLVQRGDTITVQVDLVDAVEGAELWGGKFERRLAEIASLQQEINRQVTSVLRVKLTSEQKKRLARPQTENAEAFQLYLRGRQFLSEMSTASEYLKSLDYFSQAVQKDPNYAKGWAGLACGYAYLSFQDFEPARDVMLKAREAAQKALALDPDLAEAHTSLGIVKYYDSDLPGAEAEFQRAMELNPGEDFSRHWYAHYLEKMRRFEEANAELKRVVELDPFSPMYTGDLALQYLYMRQPKKVVEIALKGKSPGSVSPWEVIALALAYEMLGQREESLATIRKMTATDSIYQAFAGALLARLGRRDEAEAILAGMKAQQGYVPSFQLAMLHLALGQTDDTFRYLEKAYEDRSTNLFEWVSIDPQWAVVRDDPRYRDLLRRLRLPPAGTAG